jgi:hypothetical protein
VFDVCQFGDFGLRGRITAQLIGDDPSRRVGTGGQALSRCRVDDAEDD